MLQNLALLITYQCVMR